MKNFYDVEPKHKNTKKFLQLLHSCIFCIAIYRKLKVVLVSYHHLPPSPRMQPIKIKSSAIRGKVMSLAEVDILYYCIA